MFLSDALYQVLYLNGLTGIQGIYSGQFFNYVLFTGLTVIGFFVNKANISQVIAGSVTGVLGFYLVSNFGTWINGLDINNNHYPKTWDGIVNCYTAALPFLKGSLFATLFFSGVFFGSHHLLEQVKGKKLAA
jgi:hypothetical protein